MHVNLEDDAFERIACQQAKLELKRSNAKLAAEKALLEMDVKAAEHFQAQIKRSIFFGKVVLFCTGGVLFMIAYLIFISITGVGYAGQ